MTKRRTVPIWVAELVTIAGCIAGCFLVLRCSPKEILTDSSDVWVAGGGFLMYGIDSHPLTLTDQHTSVDTQSLVFGAPPKKNSLEALFYNCGNGGHNPLAPSPQLFLPGAGTSGLEAIDVSAVVGQTGGPGSPFTVSINGQAVSAVASAGPQRSILLATLPAAGMVQALTEELVSFRSFTLAAGRKPTLVAGGVSNYVISGSDLVKLCNQCTTGEAGSAPVDDGASGLAAGSGYVVVTSIASDIVYVFLDTADDAAPVLHRQITTQGGSPVEVAISNQTPTAYVTVYRGAEGTDPGAVYVIDLPSLQVTGVVTVGACPTPIAIAQTLDTPSAANGDVGHKESAVLTGNQCGNTLSRIDITTIGSGTPSVQTIQLPGTPNAIATRWFPR